MRRKCAGFTLIELLVTLVVVSIIMTAVVSTFAAMNTQQINQDRLSEMEDNLRMGMDLVTDALRNAGYGLPSTNIGAWIGGGFGADPVIFPGGTSLTVATCTPAQPARTIVISPPAVPALVVGTSTVLRVSSSAGLVANTSVIALDNREPAIVRNIAAGPNITIDTNVVTAGNQAVTRVYANGTPICQVGTTAFTIGVVPSTTIPALLRSLNGAASQAVVQNITALNVTQPGPDRYRVILTAQATLKNNTTVTRNLDSVIAVRN